ncbi:hypothetical protein HYALB_00011905 [Hymenoscyphus albidus]|uniref:Uncharacterized protein n=1 Tax=Hymenoscyphus albidus TaxID=595503 RepID=A0A9N9LQ19_9HELO|nr:hypothetical protein HYALB_00011905 [Hymenoscyphus albidus]
MSLGILDMDQVNIRSIRHQLFIPSSCDWPSPTASDASNGGPTQFQHAGKKEGIPREDQIGKWQCASTVYSISRADHGHNAARKYTAIYPSWPSSYPLIQTVRSASGLTIKNGSYLVLTGSGKNWTNIRFPIPTCRNERASDITLPRCSAGITVVRRTEIIARGLPGQPTRGLVPGNAFCISVYWFRVQNPRDSGE